MTVEEELQQYIEAEYKSLLAFSKVIDMPYPTLKSMFKRGLMNSGVSNVIKLCRYLGISADGLAEGKIIANVTPRKEIFELTEEERELIEKYRALDERGRNAVDDTLDREYSYTKSFVEESSIKAGSG